MTLPLTDLARPAYTVDLAASPTDDSRIEAHPAFAAGLIPWRSSDGKTGQTLVIKASFLVEPEVCSLVTTPEPLYRQDEYWEGAADGELRQVSDLVHGKAAAEVLLVGSAFGRGPATPSVIARLQIGTIHKRISVQRTPSFPANDPRMVSVVGPLPIRYSRTLHGPKDSGCVAPSDQRLAELTASETLILEHLHPEHWQLATRLPGIRPAAALWSKGKPRLLVMRADTLTIDTERSLCTLTWRGQTLASDDGDSRIEVSLVNPSLTIDPASSSSSRKALGSEAVPLHTMELQADWVQEIVSRAPGFLQASPPTIGLILQSSKTSPSSQPQPSTDALPRTSSGLEMLPAPRDQSVSSSESLDSLTELVWYQRDAISRVRSEKAWLAGLRGQRKVRLALAPSAPEEDPTEARDVLHVLANAEPCPADRVGLLLSAHGSQPLGPLALLEGDLEPVFSLSESLAVTLAALAPFAAESPELARALEQVEAVAARPGVSTTRPALSLLIARLHGAAAGCAGIPNGYLERTVEGTLVEHRRYDDCTVMGQRYLRLLLHRGDGDAADVLPVYALPEVAERLPARRRWRARLIAEPRARLEQSSPCEVALRALAIGYRGFAE